MSTRDDFASRLEAAAARIVAGGGAVTLWDRDAEALEAAKAETGAVAGREDNPNASAYSASKAGVIGRCT